MGFFKNLLAGGPTYMDQDLFNTVVFKTYGRFRRDYPDFRTFWEGKKVLPDGKTVKTIELCKRYMSSYNRDDLISSQFGKASQLLEKHLEGEFGLNEISWQLVDLVASMSDDVSANGQKIKSTIHINASSHPNPEDRPTRLIEDFKKYTLLVNSRITKTARQR